MTPDQRQRMARFIYQEVQNLLPPFDDLDTDRQPQAAHMGSDLRATFYRIANGCEAILVEGTSA